jgi:hypothetical protein
MAHEEKVVSTPQQRVLDQLERGLRTWEDLRKTTKLNEEGLGFTLGELLSLRKIWTAECGGIRVYGYERRTDLVPRFGFPRRRVTDAVR